MTALRPRRLSNDEIGRLVSMPAAVVAVRDVLRLTADGLIDQPMRWSLADGDMLVMAASHRRSQDMVVKVLCLSPRGGDTSAPTITGNVLWWDGATGIVSVIADAVALTSLRTGAIVGVATDCLAVPGASRLAVLGAGQQALDQVRAVAAVRPITHLSIYNRTPARADQLRARLAAALPELHTTTAASAAAAVDGADVVCCATAATEPLIRREALVPHAHVNAIGSYRADMREIHTDVLAAAVIVAVDNAEACRRESGEIIAAIEAGDISASDLVELAHVLDRTERPDGVSVFKSVGMAAQDWAIASVLARSLPNGRAVPAASPANNINPRSGQGASTRDAPSRDTSK